MNISVVMAKELIQVKRNSSIELLRVLCMFFIVFHHFMIHCAFPDYESDVLNDLDGALGVALVLNGFFCVAVNCFVLITGYYGLKFKLRGFLRLYLVCAFYSLIGYFVHLYVDNASIGRSILNYSLFALTNSKWWFINCYVVLLFSAPLLNVAINAMSKELYVKVLLLLTIVNVYFGFVGGAYCYNQYGYDVQQFVFIYVIGGYLRRFVDVDNFKLHRSKYLLVFVFCSIAVGLMAIVETFVAHSELKAYYYCNPFIVVSAVSLFGYMLSFSFYNKTINRLAFGALAVYLFQEQYYIGQGWLYPMVSKLLLQWNQSYNFTSNFALVACEFGILLTFSMLFVLALLLFDQFRVLVMKPVWFVYDKIEPHLYKSKLLIKRLLSIEQ